MDHGWLNTPGTRDNAAWQKNCSKHFRLCNTMMETDAMSRQAENEKARSARISGKTTTMCKTADSICAICTDDFVKDQLVRIMPCGHLFHRGCVDEWLVERSRTCASW